MASTRFSAGLVSFYPRESEQLQLLLEKYRVASGRPDAIYSFPETLNRDPALQRDLSDFVVTSRTHPRGPVSRGAMLHLLLSGIGGPEAVDLGPEADEATRSITLFLEGLGGWPEDAFADIGDPGADDAFASPGSFRPSPPVPLRPRSIAASLASQNGHHEQLEFPPPASLPASTLQEIVLALGRLEENQHATAAKLEQISSRLRHMEEGATDIPGAGTSETSVVAAGEPFVPPAEPPVPEFAVGAKTIIPTPILSQLSASAAEDILLELPPAPAAVDPPVTAEPVSAERSASPAADPVPPRGMAALAEPVAADSAPRREWKELFAAAPERPKRAIAVVPVVIACLILAAALVAGLIYFLHSEGTAPASVSDNGAAAAPSLSEPGADSGTTPVSPAPRTSAPSRGAGQPQTAQNTRPESPNSAGREDRVLGARETYQPRSSAEAFPQPHQPAFVAASTMEARLAYAPAPQHPRIAGLVGLSGMVVMEVIVDSDGTVASVKVLGGQHLLRDAAVNAVRTWRYRPVLQNGRPVSVRTIVRMDFNKGVSQAKN